MIIEGNVITREVKINGEYLSPHQSQAVINHSPDGFMWGYGGSGPSQLALAIMLKVVDADKAVRLYQDFKWDFVSHWSMDKDFKVEIDIDQWIKQKCNEKGL